MQIKQNLFFKKIDKYKAVPLHTTEESEREVSGQRHAPDPGGKNLGTNWKGWGRGEDTGGIVLTCWESNPGTPVRSQVEFQ